MTRRLRVHYYSALLRCEPSFFDERKNSAGRLTARLSGDCALVRATLGEKFALYVQSMISLVVGLALAFSRSWRVSLIVLALAPIMVAAGMLENDAMNHGSDGAASEYETSGDIAAEAVSNVRTVHAFSMHATILSRFEAAGQRAAGPF